MSMFEDEVFNDDTINKFNEFNELNNDINPADGLPMDDTDTLDAGGSPFGFDFNDDDFSGYFDEF